MRKRTPAVQTTRAASLEKRRLRLVLQFRGVALPLCGVIRQLCCCQIELSERFAFNPPFDTKREREDALRAVEQSDTREMEIVTGPPEPPEPLIGQISGTHLFEF